ncbi:MAG: hypothetical protein NZR01_05460 [Bryobacteraceae bacterium]|nr:hypothetical protein [Bryobacteraceae bacterium]
MSARERFFAYLAAIEQRLRWRSLALGAAALTAALLAVTVAAAWFGLRYAFDPRVLLAGRLALVLACGAVLALGIAAPLLRINRRRAALLAEKKLDGLDERAATLAGPAAESPLAELVAEEALRIAEAAPPRSLVGNAVIAAGSVAASAALAVLLWLTSAAPGTLGYGARLLWAGAPPSGQQPLFQLVVRPGNARIRRGGDQVVEALVAGLDASGIQIRLRRAGAAQWESLPMEPNPAGAGYIFLLAGVTEDIEYQVDARRMRSPVYRLSVVDLPRVEKIRVRYRYPAWLGLPEKIEDPGGDVRAVENTIAELEILTDRPLPNGVLQLDDGTRIRLAPAGERLARAQLEVRRDGAYYIAALDGGAPVRLTEDYFIEAQPERAPEVRLTRPGRDARVSPIEEVVVEAEAADDFGLRTLEITYSVNGGEPRTVRLPVAPGAREARGRTVIALEEFRLQPGDIVALSATARDARAAAQTDIFFLEAQPFEREFQQSQTMGGGAGGMEGEEEDADIVQRQKEIIAATWNQIRTPRPRAQAQEDAAFLSGVQEKLSAQAQSLAQRMRSRQLAAMSEESRKFSELMAEASKAMQEASGRLRSLAWRDALAPEQRALQNLLRAESLFRQIQVAFGQQGGGRGSGGSQLRDLESLFELELDLEKNQYETVQTASGSASRERQIDEALKKLEELARRQQQAAAEQQRNQQSFQQRWQQEMLRREAEELRRQLEELQRSQRGQSGQLSRNQQGGQSSQSGDSGQPSQSSSSRSGSPQSARLSRAQQELERAIEDMRRAQSAQGSQAQENARRAAERMQQALSELGQLRQREAGDRMDDLSRRASELAERQRRYEEQLRKLFPQADGSRPQQQPGQPAGSASDAERLAREKESMQRDYQRLEQDMREAARALDGSQRGAASRLRQALGEAQQDEVGLRMRLGAEWMRRGLGPYLAPRERVLTEALDRLSRQVEEARQMAGREGGNREQREQVERALGQIESLREQLERQARAGRQGREGQQAGGRDSQPQQGRDGQPGQGRDGQPQRAGSPQGQQGGRAGDMPAPGDPQGRRRQTGGDTSFWRGDYGALNDGSLQPDWSRSGDASGARGSWMDALRQLRELREQGAISDETQEELDRLLRQMQRLDPSRFGSPLLTERIEREVLPQLEQLELRLRRELGEKTAPPRAAAPAKAPPGYAEAVAEYFRRLSRSR